MPMLDPDTGDYNAGAFALDTHAALNDQPSLFESASNVITKGIPLTGLAIVNSFANTGIEVSNWLTGSDTKKWDVDSEVGPGDYADYYDKHSQGIEAAGLIAGSLLPGMAAIKVLKLAQLGKAGDILQAATNIFNGPKEKLIENALNEINAGDGALFGGFKADKFRAIALGYGDQALQALAYEAATAGTMHASPLLDKQGLDDVVSNMFYGALIGAGVGGSLEAIGIRSIFNKAIVTQDLLTKPQEIATYLSRQGFSNIGGGDRTLMLLKSIEDMPPGTNTLGTTKSSMTSTAADLNARAILKNMAGGDGEVGDAMFGVLKDSLASIKTGDLSASTDEVKAGVREEIYNRIARLVKINRVDAPDTVPDGSVFYVNRAAGKQILGLDGAITSTPNENAALSLGYRLKDGSSAPSIARFADTAGVVEGQKVPMYTSAKEAFDAGHDMYIDKDLKVKVNPDAPNIERAPRPGENRVLNAKEEFLYRQTGQLPEGAKPLTGSNIIMNTITKGISNKVVPVIGDFGKPNLFDKGIQTGSKSSLQSLASPLTKDTDTLDANARYVWAAMRGLKNGDSIASTDIPMLEQMSREVGKIKDPDVSVSDYLSNKNISFSDGTPLPNTQEDLLNRIRSSKDSLIQDLIKSDPKMSSEEVALRANVPQDYLSNGFHAESPKDYMIDPMQHAQVNHVKLEYDLGNVRSNDGMILRGMQDVQYRIGLIKDVNQSATAKYFGDTWDQFISNKSSSDASILGAGAKFFSFARAAYNSLAQDMERIGRNMSSWQTQRMSTVSGVLAPSVNALRDDAVASAELGLFRAVRQRTNEKFSFLPDGLAQKYFVGKDALQDGEKIAVLNKSLVYSKGQIVDWNKEFLPTDNWLDGSASAQGKEGNYTYYKLNKKVSDFETANMTINNQRIGAWNDFNAAVGKGTTINPDTLYTPPINTNRYSHFALVKQRPGMGMSDDSVSVITALNKEELQQKLSSLDQNQFSIWTKDQIKQNHEIVGDYEYQKNFANGYVDSELSRRGILNNVYPDTRAETIIKDYVDWHTRQELRLARNYTELGNAQLFEELRQMGKRFEAPDTSQVGFLSPEYIRSAENPYNSYIKTALNIGPREEYRFWNDAQEKLEAFFDTAFRVAKQGFFSAKSGIISYEDASNMAAKFGLGNPYKASTDALSAYYNVANKLPPERYLTKFVSTANGILGASIIKLDTFQQVIHLLSTPILTLSETNSVKDLLTTELPDGSGRQIPAVSKVFYQAVSDFWNKDIRDSMLPIYKEIGSIRKPNSEYFQMIEQLTLPYGKWTQNGLNTALDNAMELGTKVSGANFVEEFTDWMASRSAHILFSAAGYTGKDLTDNIASFVNRIKGNIIGSQRPVAFQGPLGQAVGLFQTYQFNMMQNLFRYVENGEGKTLAILAGLQTTLFGMQGLPGFQAINNHIVGNAAGNPQHKDLYSTTTNFLDKKLGDYLLYGVASNVLNAGLYSRGDINPRNITLLPVNPLNYPAIAGGIRVVGNILDTADKLIKGGNLGQTILLGLEHNGLNRPLAGMAQLAQGFSTTSQGSLISATTPPTSDGTMGLNEIYNAGIFSRLLGARPLDEAVTLDAMYRRTLYQAKTDARIEDIGKAVKTTLYAGDSPSQDQIQSFVSQYASAGGDISTFGRKLQTWSQAANASVANKIFKNLKSPGAQQMQMIMGGQPLPNLSSDETNNQPSGLQ